MVASLVTALAWILLSQRLMKTHKPTVVTSYSILSGTLMLAGITVVPWVLHPMFPSRSLRRCRSEQ